MGEIGSKGVKLDPKAGIGNGRRKREFKSLQEKEMEQEQESKGREMGGVRKSERARRNETKKSFLETRYTF